MTVAVEKEGARERDSQHGLISIGDGSRCEWGQGWYKRGSVASAEHQSSNPGTAATMRAFMVSRTSFVFSLFPFLFTLPFASYTVTFGSCTPSVFIALFYFLCLLYSRFRYVQIAVDGSQVSFYRFSREFHPVDTKCSNTNHAYCAGIP